MPTEQQAEETVRASRRARERRMWAELVDGMEYHRGVDEDFLSDPGWVEDLEAYCALTDQREADVLSEIRGAALARLEDRERR